MAGNPSTQKFKTVMDFGIPRTFLSNDDVLNALNSIPGNVFDDALAGMITVQNFLTHNIDVRSVTITRSHWEQSHEDNTKAVLVSTMTTVSDPMDANTLALFLTGVALAAGIAAAVLAILTGVGIVVGVPIIITEVLVVMGVVALIAVIVTEITGTVGAVAGSPLLSGAVLLIGGGIAVAGAAYLLRNPGASRSIISAGRSGIGYLRGRFAPG